ncbi:hypothetical protein KM043_001813 [Ampulex compressa]|nr:hypothetical protein KM043_001813 [Ampulex compressa]
MLPCRFPWLDTTDRPSHPDPGNDYVESLDYTKPQLPLRRPHKNTEGERFSSGCSLPETMDAHPSKARFSSAKERKIAQGRETLYIRPKSSESRFSSG